MTRNYKFKWWHALVGLLGLGAAASILGGRALPPAVQRVRLEHRGWDIEIVRLGLHQYRWEVSVYVAGIGRRSVKGSGVAPSIEAAEQEAKELIG